MRRKVQLQEQHEREEEARIKERERKILDYSVKVNSGKIEVKMGEDEDAMRQAWKIHMDARAAVASKYTNEELIAMGLGNYDWPAWKRYYRKKNGMPENGIKVIDFTSDWKNKKRNIVFAERAALSVQEMANLKLEYSKDGPVMIPMARAMEVASTLFNGRKTIYSIRDGLEVMKMGLVTET